MKNTIRKLTPKKGVHIEPSEGKLEELVVLLASRSQDDPNFGQIKLNKLLFHCDFLAYLMLGKPITGQEYFALENGPALSKKIPLWRRMESRKAIAVRKEDSFSPPREVTLALRDPDVTKFTSQELDLIYRVLAHCRNMTGSDLTAITHRFPGWELARHKERIPYPVALVGNRAPSKVEITIGLEIEEALANAA